VLIELMTPPITMRRWIKYVYATMHATAQNSSTAAVLTAKERTSKND
jgi:hypothetical protein